MLRKWENVDPCHWEECMIEGVMCVRTLGEWVSGGGGDAESVPEQQVHEHPEGSHLHTLLPVHDQHLTTTWTTTSTNVTQTALFIHTRWTVQMLDTTVELGLQGTRGMKEHLDMETFSLFRFYARQTLNCISMSLF